MFENPRSEGHASKKFYNKCSENSRSQIVFRTDIFQKLTLGVPVFPYQRVLLVTAVPLDVLIYV